jgi:hypothetical protein
MSMRPLFYDRCAINRRLLLAASLMLLAALIVLPGCSRAYYRQQADVAVTELIDEKSILDERYGLSNFHIDVSPQSRMYDPSDPDGPPMPTDDPESNKLMDSVAGYEGFQDWLENGTTDQIDNPTWREHLPLDENGVLHITGEQAVALSLMHSTQYQGTLETLYLSALDVTSERFRFDSQYYFGYGPSIATAGPAAGGPSSQFSLSTRNAQVRRLMTSGATLAVGLANSLMWQFSGPDSYSTNTVIDLTLIQPLLRRAGRDRVLETLTIAERALLANVRQFEQYRRGHYMDILTGSGRQQGLQRRGGFFGAAGLGGFSGVGSGGFGTRGAGTFGGGGGATAPGSAGGYIGMLQAQQSMRNQEASVSALQSSLAQLEAFRDAGRIDFFQVEQLRQQLLTSSSGLLSTRRGYVDGLDGFKQELGLSPDINVVVEGDFLNQFNLIDPRILPVQQRIAEIQQAVGQSIVSVLPTPPAGEAPPPLVWSDELTTELVKLRVLVIEANMMRDTVLAENVAYALEDIEQLKAVIPERLQDLQSLQDRIMALADDDYKNFDPALVVGLGLTDLPTELTATITDLVGRMKANQAPGIRVAEGIDLLMESGPELNEDQLLNALRAGVFGPLPGQLTEFSANVLEVSLVQAEARAETVMLIPVDVDVATAVALAREHRLDWANTRASMVDSWRLIRFNADNLESQLDIVFSGNISNTQDNPIRLRDSTGNLRLGLQWDAPITRLQERNTYRQALIEYQQARRRYYQFEDSIVNGFRTALRQVNLNRINFEVRRAALRVAIKQVQSARLRLQEPPQIGQGGQANSFGPTTAQNLISSLTSLRNAQDDFLSVWVNWEVQRGLLDLNFGTMQLDEYGMWIDPGPLVPENGYRIEPPE